MHNLPREKLAEIIRTYGQILTEDPRRVESLLRDLCPRDTREINLLVGATREQVPADLLAASGTQPFALLAERLCTRLCADLGITDQAARWAVESWALALGIVQLSQLSNTAAKSRLEAGNTLIDQGHFAQAAAEFQEAIRLDPEYAEAYNNLGIALAEQGEMQAAADAFGHAVRLDPQDAESQTNLGNAFLQLGQPENAIAPLQAALQLDPNAADVEEALAQARSTPGSFPNTADTAPSPEMANEVNPSTASRHTALGEWLKNPGHRPILLACVVLAVVVLYFLGRSTHTPSSLPNSRLPTYSAVPAATTTNVSSDEGTKFPVQWGVYTITREVNTEAAEDSQQKVNILDADGQSLWETQDIAITNAVECDVTGTGLSDFEIVTYSGGNHGDGKDYYFSRQNGLHLLFSCDTGTDGIDKFEHLDKMQRPEIIYS